MLSIICVTFFACIFMLKNVFCITITDLIKFLLLNIISFFIPGIVLISFINIRLSKFSFVFFSYALGNALIIIEYFFSESTERVISFRCITLIVLFLACVLLVLKFRKGKKAIKFVNDGNDIIALSFFCLFLCLSFFAYAANYLGTDVRNFFDASRDMQYWLSNTVALKIAFPPSNLFMDGSPLNYHYFSNIPIAFLSAVYDIDIFTLSFPFYSFTKAILLVGSVWFFFDVINANRKLRIYGMLLCLFTTGIEEAVKVTFLHHILLGPFGFDISFAYGMYFTSLLLLQWNKGEFDKNIFFPTLIVWMTCVGAKGPSATVLIIFPAFLCFAWLISKNWKLSFGYGLSILGLYLIISKFCIGLFSVLKGASSWKLSGFYSINDILTFPETDSWIVRFLIKIGQSNVLFAVIVKIFMQNPAVFFGGSISMLLIADLIRKRSLHFKEIYCVFALICTVIFGYVLWFIVNAGGHSEMYFCMILMVPQCVIICLTYVYKEKYGNICSQGNVYIKSMSIFFLAFGIYMYSMAGYENQGAIRSSVNGLKRLVEQDSPQSDIIQPYGIRKTDVEALEWIRDHTSMDSVILSDKAVMMDNPGFYLYGAFCERQQYLEGTDMLALAGEEVQKEILKRKKLINDVYNNKINAISEISLEGVDYIVQTRDITPEFLPDKSLVALVKSTDTMNIYKIKRSSTYK